MRYFTEGFLLRPDRTRWAVIIKFPLQVGMAGTTVRNLETGHIWELTGESEKWSGGLIYLGRWPD